MKYPSQVSQRPWERLGIVWPNGSTEYYNGIQYNESNGHWLTIDYPNTEDKSEIHLVFKGKLLLSEEFPIQDLSSVFDKSSVKIDYEGRHYTFSKSSSYSTRSSSGKNTVFNRICIDDVEINDEILPEVSFEPVVYSGCYGNPPSGSNLDSSYYMAVEDEGNNGPYKVYVRFAGYNESFFVIYETGLSSQKTTWYNINIENHICRISKGSLQFATTNTDYYSVCLNRTGTLW